MSKRPLLLAVSSVLGLCIVAGLLAIGFALLGLRGPRAVGPEVFIRAPGIGQQVDITDGMLVEAFARDPDGVQVVELWADGRLVAVDTSDLPGGSTPFPLLADWRPAGPGTHILVVRAYDTTGKEGQASVAVEGADITGETPAYLVHAVEEGEDTSQLDTMPDSVAEAVAEAHPEMAESLQSGDVVLLAVPADPAEEGEPAEAGPLEAAPGEEAPAAIPALDRLGWLVGSLGRLVSPMPGQWLEVEALALTVDRAYDGVYCYASLAGGDMERVPAEGSLAPSGAEYWSIDVAMGGTNRRLVPIPAGRAPLTVVIQCLGYNESTSGGEVFDLGTLSTAHPEGDWDGRRLEPWVRGSQGWFRVAYRITERALIDTGEEPFPSPAGLSRRCFENEFLNIVTCVLSWNYPEDHLGDISGYIVVRNGAFYADLPLGLPSADMRELILLEGEGIPPCGETYEYSVLAYSGDLIAGPRSGPSNAVTLAAEACPGRRVQVTFETLNTVCLTGDCVENPFELDTEGRYIPPEGPLDSVGCDRGRGCEGGEMYATLWANGHEINLGGMDDFGLLYSWEGGGIYPISDMVTWGDSNPIQMDLSPFESLDIRMRLYDYDSSTADDLQCSGGYLFSSDDLLAIERGPDRRQTLTRAFNEDGGGACYLVFTVQVEPIITAPER